MLTADIDPTVFMRPSPISRDEWGKPLPLGAITDLQICTSVIADVAKTEFFRRNPKRKRIPTKFIKKFLIRLDYESTEENPKAPILIREPHINKSINPHFLQFISKSQYNDEFSASRDLVMGAIINASLGQSISQTTSLESLKKLGKIGGRVGSEGLVLAKNFLGHDCNLTPETKRQFKNIVSTTSNEYFEDTGIICAVDIHKHTFKLLTSDKKIIPVKFRNEQTHIIRSAFDNYIESKIHIRGNAKINYLGNIILVDSIQSLEEAGNAQPNLDIDSRLSEISSLQPGWYDGTGAVISNNHLDSTKTILKSLKDFYSIPVPYIYPVPDGNIQVEWSQDQWEITLLLNFINSEVEFFAFDKMRSITKEFDLPFIYQQNMIDVVDTVAELYNSLLFEGA